MTTPKIEADKELDFIMLGLSQEAVNSGEAKTALLAWRDAAVMDARIEAQIAILDRNRYLGGRDNGGIRISREEVDRQIAQLKESL